MKEAKKIDELPRYLDQEILNQEIVSPEMLSFRTGNAVLSQ